MQTEFARLDQAVRSILDHAGATAVLAVGDVMLDRFISGSVERISPEAPIPVLAVRRRTAMAGGVGNVLANIRALGGRAQLVAVIGQDAEADAIRSLIGSSDDFGGVVDPSRPTAVKERFVAGGQQLLRADYEVVRPVDSAIEDAILAEIERRLPSVNVLVLSDYGKGVLTDRVLQSAIALARSQKIAVVVDPKGADYARYRGASLVTPNLKELTEAAGGPIDGDDSVVKAARDVLARSGIDAMIATRGREGLSVITSAGEAIHIRAKAREVFDVSGAGDTVVATLALALAVGADLSTAAGVANLAAAIVVGKVGTAVATPAELSAAVDGTGHRDLKIMPLPALIDQVERWRRRGLRIGFTNGCFDLLHPGHLSLLHQARVMVDRLVVGLNSDASVRRLKGPTRPISDQSARGIVLAAVADVDAVAIFDEDTPEALIGAVRPDVLVKGADYAIEEIVGAEFVQSYGGLVVRANLEPGHSTTSMIARISADG